MASFDDAVAAREQGDTPGAFRLLHSLFLELSRSNDVASVGQLLGEAERLAVPGDPIELQARWLAQQARLYLRAWKHDRDWDAEIARADREMAGLPIGQSAVEDPNRQTDDEPAAKQPAPLAAVLKCVVIGGHGLRPRRGETWHLLFFDDELQVRLRSGSDIETVPYAAITALELSGAGATQSGGGFFGGGALGKPAEEGILIATALNLLTTRTKFDAVVCIQTATAELFLHHDKTTPDDLRITLSPVFSKLRELAANRESSTGVSHRRADESVIDQLERLAGLLERGLIDPAEFKKIKDDLLR